MFIPHWIYNNLLYKTRDSEREGTGEKGEAMMGSILDMLGLR